MKSDERCREFDEIIEAAWASAEARARSNLGSRLSGRPLLAGLTEPLRYRLDLIISRIRSLIGATLELARRVLGIMAAGVLLVAFVYEVWLRLDHPLLNILLSGIALAVFVSVVRRRRLK